MTKAELYKKACMLPLLPGVYIIRDKSDTIIYIGKAKRLKTRVSQYFREGVPQDAKVGQMIAEKAKAAGITDVVFDRGGYVYHGRVAALAEGAREGGLNF